ncbi:type II secretion system F family protein [Aliiglaciecola litoralis]
MAQFNFTGRAANGDLTSGLIDAADASTAAKMLAGRNVTPLNIYEASEDDDNNDVIKKINFFTPKVSLEDLVIFARQMYSLSKSGIPILRAVNGLADTTNSQRMQVALRDVVEQLERGRTFSSALHQHPHIFNQLFVSVVHVGENTGKLDAAFLQLSDYLVREQETRKQIKSATRYPIFVLIALVAALVVMNIWVIPIFATMFEKFDAELPLMTRFLLGMSDMFVTKWPFMLVVVGLIVFAVKRYLSTDAGRYKWDKRKISLPVIGSVLERTLLGRFARSFSMMLVSGVPLTSALNLVAEAVDNSFMGERILNMRRSIEKGESLSRVAHASQMFTPLVMQMITVGEETGRVDELLGEVADYYEREVDYDLKNLTAKIEPILIVIVAIMVLILALGIFTPMWEMMGAYKGDS